jgi:hypothetical protein
MEYWSGNSLGKWDKFVTINRDKKVDNVYYITKDGGEEDVKST